MKAVSHRMMSLQGDLITSVGVNRGRQPSPPPPREWVAELFEMHYKIGKIFVSVDFFLITTIEFFSKTLFRSCPQPQLFPTPPSSTISASGTASSTSSCFPDQKQNALLMFQFFSQSFTEEQCFDKPSVIC